MFISIGFCYSNYIDPETKGICIEKRVFFSLVVICSFYYFVSSRRSILLTLFSLFKIHFDLQL